MADVRMTVNGVPQRVDGGTTMLAVLRHEFELTGSRFGCGTGSCGACYVLVDGRPMASCELPVGDAAGKSVTTVEGLGVGHPALLRAFADENAAQCGYCLSGVLISAAALLDRNPDPTVAEITAALDRHLCRCGAQPRILRAIQRAAAGR